LPLEIHLLLRDIHLACPAYGNHRRWRWAAPLQRLEILEQLAIYPLTQGEQLFFESLQLLLDREPVKLPAILLTQLDSERFLSEQFMLDRERYIPGPALNSQEIVVAHHYGVDHHHHRR